MTFYMLRDLNTGRYYKRGCLWVPAEYASVWTTLDGPRAALGAITKYNRRIHYENFKPANPTIVQFERRETSCPAANAKR